MQNIALILLLAVMASMVFSLDAQVLAQETPETTSDEGVVEETPEETTEEASEETMDEEVMEDEVTDEGLEEQIDDQVSEEETMETTMEVVDSPLLQLLSGVDPHEIQCKSGQTLVFKASNWRPACVNESSVEILAMRGWVSSHDPSHEDLAQMQDDYMSEYAVEEEPMEETEDTSEEQIEIEEDVVMEDEAAGNGTDTEGQVEQQSYTINLTENMEMGAN